MRRAAYVFSLVVCLLVHVSAQTDSAGIYRNRKLVLGGAITAYAVGSLAFLQQAWYSEYQNGQFHWFNDNSEWMQLDKAGHCFSTYQMSRLGMQSFHWAGFSKQKEVWIGGTLGWFYMGAVEILDGYSQGWGFSWGDIAANTLGTGLAISQRLAWDEQRIQLKFSYYPSTYAQYNPALLGDSWNTRIIKDYNGQTYWISFSPFTFVKDTKMPKWINLALGYGATGMIGAEKNPVSSNPELQLKPVSRERVFYLSLDLNLDKLPIKSKFLKGVCSVVNVFKIPFPALGFSPQGLSFYAIK